jgi:NAD(P)-dependent dehydrogenase (short-subunit alcohol dehydrogenase family)
VIGYRNSEESARSVLADIAASGGTAHAARIDVTDAASVAGTVNDAVRRYGRLDVVVNAAGGSDDPTLFAQFAASDEKAFAALLDVDLLGTFRVCQAAAEHLRASGNGAIVNFSSTYRTGTNLDNFITSLPATICAAKGGVRALTSALARDLAPEVRVNAVAPGPIAPADWEEQGMDWEDLGISRDHIDEVHAVTPLGRMGYPEEIAETVLYLASDGGGYTTGQVLEVNGGWTMGG